MSTHRKVMRSYNKAQELHKAVHRLTKGFEEDATDEELTARINRVVELVKQLLEIWKK